MRADATREPSCAIEAQADARPPALPRVYPGRAARMIIGAAVAMAAVAMAAVMGCGTAPPITDVTVETTQPDGGAPDPRDPNTTRADEDNHERLHDDNTNVMKP